MNTKSLTKRELAAELGSKTDTPVPSVLAILDALAETACREAANGFIIPGICKLAVTRRKARNFRHPGTGKLFRIGERDAVTAVVLKKCKTEAVEVPDDLIAPIDEPSPAPPSQPAAPTLPDTDDVEDAELGLVFTCDQCGNTLSAAMDQANTAGMCPFCHAAIQIPASGMQLPAATNAEHDKPGCKATELTGFVTFVCGTCNQEIEAPYNMIGVEAACPSCGSTVQVPPENEVPAETEPELETETVGSMQRPDMRSMTIRIDLSDVT